ncbi:TGS domain-containing protein [Paenibacillus sp. IB182363]|uniref:TGS domain-containing protein n=1 Tax=Paenibacillus oceani TaxID=2772510 RepID=A0A927CCY3_9BACL|nr:TGS domain-containing protein [Paenibacillus oceani]
MSIQVELPDGSVREYVPGTTVAEVAGSISSSLKKLAAAAKVNGKLVDLSCRLENSAKVEIITLDGAEGLEVYRHSTAHLMAQALKQIYGNKEVKLGIGPVIQDGFYYRRRERGTRRHSLGPQAGRERPRLLPGRRCKRHDRGRCEGQKITERICCIA